MSLYSQNYTAKGFPSAENLADFLVFKDQISPLEAKGYGAVRATKAHRHATWVRALCD